MGPRRTPTASLSALTCSPLITYAAPPGPSILIDIHIQPIGTGFSYGRMPNNSRDAALDVYDFLQKFFVLFPHLAKLVTCDL